MHGIAKEGAQWDPSEWSLIALTGTRRHLLIARGGANWRLIGGHTVSERSSLLERCGPPSLCAARSETCCGGLRPPWGVMGGPPIAPRDPPCMRGGAVRSRCALSSAAPVLSRDLLQHCGAPPLCDARSESCCCGLRPPMTPHGGSWMHAWRRCARAQPRCSVLQHPVIVWAKLSARGGSVSVAVAHGGLSTQCH